MLWRIKFVSKKKIVRVVKRLSTRIIFVLRVILIVRVVIQMMEPNV
jgi:hypothetical protein